MRENTEGEYSSIGGRTFEGTERETVMQDTVSERHGRVLWDLGPACTGTIGIDPSANLNPDRRFPSMFEPVHGSAPDIAGRNIANPVGQIWSGAMMLDHLGHAEAAAAVVRAIEAVLGDGPRTPDIGGTASTQDLGKAIAAAI